MATITPPQLSEQPTEPQSCQAVAFQIAGHWLALPHMALLRVVHKTALTKTFNSDKLVYLGKQPLSILNLHLLLETVHSDRSRLQNQSTVTKVQSEAPFLVIAAIDTTLVGIPVDQPPILLDLPLTATHTIPSAYYMTIGGIASHIITVPQIGTVFLLNLSACVTRIVSSFAQP